jgi:hypothetical protein
MNKEDRIENMKKQQEKINKNVELIDAVVGDNLDLDELIHNGTLSPNAELFANDSLSQEELDKIHKREIGCWLSHKKLYETIINKNITTGYSIILEDDYNLVYDFNEKLKQTINTIEDNNLRFDIIFLGLITNNIGEQLVDNIYKMGDKVHYGTHGYLVNNKSIKKLNQLMSYITTTVDVEIIDKGKTNQLLIYRLNENIINQSNFGTTIR